MLGAALALLFQVPGLPQAPAPETAVSKQEARLAAATELAGRVLKAVEVGDLEQFRACIDIELLVERATRGIEAPESMRGGFVTGVNTTLMQNTLGGLHQRLEEGGDLRLLRVREHEGEMRPLLRLIRADGGMDYIELALQFPPAGAPKVRDWFSFGLGEWTSDLMRHVYLPLATQAQRGLLERLIGREQLFAKHWRDIEKLSACARRGDVEGGREALKRLPEELLRDKLVLLQRMILESSQDDAEYISVLEDLRKYFPDDPACDMHAIDIYYARKQYDRARKAIARLRDSIGGDPHLDFLEANLLLELGQDAEARKFIERSLAAEPGLEDPHWTYVTVCLRLRDYDAVLAGLKRMDERFEVEWADFTTLDPYKDFAASPQGAQWKAYLAAKK